MPILYRSNHSLDPDLDAGFFVTNQNLYKIFGKVFLFVIILCNVDPDPEPGFFCSVEADFVFSATFFFTYEQFLKNSDKKLFFLHKKVKN